MVSKGNHPQMAARFKLVKYYNLPRMVIWMVNHIYMDGLWMFMVDVTNYKSWGLGFNGL